MSKSDFEKVMKGNNFDENNMSKEKFPEIEEDFREFEKSVLNSPLILQHATPEELGSFDLLGKLPEEDINQMLLNMADILLDNNNIEKEEHGVILQMSRDFLKLLLIERWIGRVDSDSVDKLED